MALAKRTRSTTKKLFVNPTKKPQRTKPLLNVARWGENLRKRYQKNPTSFYAGIIAVLIIALIVYVFWFNRGLLVAGSVNGRLITTPEFYSRLVKTGGEQVFDNLVRDILLRQEASKKGVTATKEEVDTKIEQIEKSLGGKDSFEAALSQNKTSLDTLREQITIKVLVEKLLADQIKVSDSEVVKFISENKETTTGKSKEEVKEALQSQKLNEKFQTWYEELKNKAKITKYF